PIPKPNRSPSGRELNLREKKPVATPAMSPLTVEPITMPTMPFCTTGSLGAETSAERPSSAPSAAPRRSPGMGFLMGFSKSVVRPAPGRPSFYSALPATSLTRPPENQQNAHDQIRRDQQNRRAVEPDQPQRPLGEVFAIREDRPRIQELVNVGQQGGHAFV